ncbi:MAG: branched-chain amino acid transport system substrate-binding protein [Rhodothermales bacterium]|jgi:branched-chain amino acid transport system substrate-binding protein
MGVIRPISRTFAGVCFCVLLLTPFATPWVKAQAPDSRIAEIAEADTLFDRAVQLFEAGNYTEAAGQFSRVAQSFGLHRYTTAAAFMEARSLYRVGAFGKSVSAFEAFLGLYPSSRFVAEAERSLRLAKDALSAKDNSPVTLGIILSLSGDEASSSQAVFNGVRLAVEAHNMTENARPVRLVFRDIALLGPRGAVDAVVEEGAIAIFGGLFSDQARVAAAAAEAHGVVFVAPLATDPQVTAGRSFVFQANPTIPMRGRLMARFAVNALRLNELAVIAEADDGGISEEMGRAFADEAELLGATVRFVNILPTATEWFRLGSTLDADSLRGLDAIYTPVSGAGADRLAGALLSSLDGVLGTGAGGLGSGLRILGNAEWHDLPIRAQASRYRVTYSNDFFFDRQSDRAQAFTRRYRSLTGVDPDRLGVVGFDLTRYLIDLLRPGGVTELRDIMLSAPPFEGIGVRTFFGGQQVNQQMFYHRYRDGNLELMR